MSKLTLESNTVIGNDKRKSDRPLLRCSPNATRTSAKRNTSKTLIICLLVAYDLIQVTSNLINTNHNHQHHHQSQHAAPGLLVLAGATQATNHDKEIIVLNATNFNTELIQHNHPFPHIKLVEYYLPYCGICLRFKQTYIQLSKDIFSWRNVIRLSAIDLGVSNNSPIAHSWSIDVVPTLKIHPPPGRSLAAKLNGQLLAWSQSMQPSQLQKSMYQEYSGANLMIKSLGVIKYTANDTRRDSVALLKQDLISYIDQYHPDEIPATWPNLRPVTEKTLAELKLNHPRKELFLLVETNSNTDPSSNESMLGLEVIMELSSSASWKAIRYVRASDNEDLIDDVIAHKMRELTKGDATMVDEQVKLLSNLLSTNQSNQNSNITLIHIDDSHDNANSTKKSLHIEVITNSDLIANELQLTDRRQTKRSTRSSSVNGENRDDKNPYDLSLKRKVELIVLYINETYVGTEEDLEFLNALNSFDENPTLHNLKREAVEKFQATQQENQVTLSLNPKRQSNLPNGFNYIIVIILCSLFLIVLLRCASCYIERQRRHKANMLNVIQYPEELQRCYT
jgi:hypothetical protein